MTNDEQGRGVVVGSLHSSGGAITPDKEIKGYLLFESGGEVRRQHMREK